MSLELRINDHSVIRTRDAKIDIAAYLRENAGDFLSADCVAVGRVEVEGERFYRCGDPVRTVDARLQLFPVEKRSLSTVTLGAERTVRVRYHFASTPGIVYNRYDVFRLA